LKTKVVVGVANDSRQELLDNTAESAGELWASARCVELGLEGRAAMGGWPGTVGEARARAGFAIRDVLRKRGMLGVTHAELVRASRVAYEAARRSWLRVSRRATRGKNGEDDDDDTADDVASE
jgi:hypothetical protein